MSTLLVNLGQSFLNSVESDCAPPIIYVLCVLYWVGNQATALSWLELRPVELRPTLVHADSVFEKRRLPKRDLAV